MRIVTGLKLHEMADRREITQLLREQIKNEEVWERAWNYCKKLASFTHAPVSIKEYMRMEEFAEDDGLAEEVFQVVKNYKVPENPILTGFDTIGYFYSIALLSTAKTNREQYIRFFNELADQWIEAEHSYCSLLHRNMKRLSKKFPDLKEIELKLTPFAGNK